MVVQRDASQQDLINHLPKYKSEDLREREQLNKQTGLLAVPWVEQLLQHPDYAAVLTCGAMLADEAPVLPRDHMFAALLKVGLIQDMLCLFNLKERQFHSLVTLGKNVCGHPGIVHGGLTAALIDETLGGINYMLKKHKLLPSGPAFTVHLEVDYKKPVPAGSHVICTASLESNDGRKTWVTATVSSQPGGDVYATGKALFVVPKQHPLDRDQQRQHGEQTSNGTGTDDRVLERAQTESTVERQLSQNQEQAS
jgi:acyl-coenzyme A thioesterase PaaI-like protein